MFLLSEKGDREIEEMSVAKTQDGETNFAYHLFSTYKIRWRTDMKTLPSLTKNSSFAISIMFYSVASK